MSATTPQSKKKHSHSSKLLVRKWSHYLHGNTFTLATDQRSVAFMFDNKRRGKIKNAKILMWRIELGVFSYGCYVIKYSSGKETVVPDAFSWMCDRVPFQSSLADVHEYLYHPGATWLMHFAGSKKLPFSLSDVKQVCSQCRVCAETKPKFRESGVLIKAKQPWQRISIDFLKDR